MRALLLESDFFSAIAKSNLKEHFQVTELESLDDIARIGHTIEILFVKLKYNIDHALLTQMPALKYIVSPTTGLMHIDLEFCKQKNITVICLKNEIEFLRDLTATAELTWSLILSSYRQITKAFQSVKEDTWDRSPFVGNELKGKTLGIIGMGRLGTIVAQYAKAFLMKVIYFDPFVQNASIGSSVDKQTLLHESDIISLHVHATPENFNMITENEFNQMQKKPLLVNTSRGELIDEEALLKALMQNRIRGACLDVLSHEHKNTSEEQTAWAIANKLIQYSKTHDNLLITPHIGGLTYESVAKAEEFVVNKLLSLTKK